MKAIIPAASGKRIAPLPPGNLPIGRDASLAHPPGAAA